MLEQLSDVKGSLAKTPGETVETIQLFLTDMRILHVLMLDAGEKPSWDDRKTGGAMMTAHIVVADGKLVKDTTFEATINDGAVCLALPPIVPDQTRRR
jgi:hypothetical protein